jgi:hypothetical protein
MTDNRKISEDERMVVLDDGGLLDDHLRDVMLPTNVSRTSVLVV